jgi:hypothetical protein
MSFVLNEMVLVLDWRNYLTTSTSTAKPEHEKEKGDFSLNTTISS